ncbi:MAG: hypothetical protein EU542_08075 [Promethearchaeota archaeon]|nr:MAG: hypothetical protein EU542_08075 [Candidatus Lokiarchaeota archaeon]
MIIQTLVAEVRLSSNGGTETFTGDYSGDLSTVYFEQYSNSSTWINANSSTNILPYNASYYDKEYSVRSIDITAENLINTSGVGTFTIAENISNQISLTPSYSFAQEFIAPELCRIDEIMIYVNFHLFRNCYYDIFIFDEFLQEEIDWAYKYETRLIIDEWISVNPKSNVLKGGEKYNIVLKMWFSPGAYNETFDYWKAEQYSNSSLNKGITRRFDGKNWFSIPDDDITDMLCNFSYTKFIDPADVDLKFIINNKVVEPIYQIPPWASMGYQAFISYTFETPLDQNINVTVVTNQTIPNLEVWIEIYYIYLINATGSYVVDENKMEWVITYPYEDIPFGWPPPLFLFESDWTLIQLNDPDDVEMTEIYFGPITIYNKSYYGITNFFGPPLESGNYTGIFQSPNYCNSIFTKIKSGGNYINKPTIQLGQTIQLEAEITNLFNLPISGGIGQILLTSPTGETIYNETNLSSVNGSLSTSDIIIGSGFESGNYKIQVFWTNGKEAGYYIADILVEAPVNILFWVFISIGIALISVASAIVSRKYIRQRNWEKSLKNLFVLTKDGLSLYEYSFGIEIQDPALISAMISALTNFVREATGSNKFLRTVDQEDKKVILYHGNKITTALLSEKDLPIIHKRVKRFTEAFEEKFGSILKKWSGEVSAFKQAEVLVNKNFPIDVEDQIIRGVRGKLIEFRNRLEIMKNPREIISLMKEITEFISRYRSIVNEYYIDYYSEIITIAEEKISSS